MVFRLAMVMGCTVAELGDRMTAKEFLSWCDYYSVEPWGCEAEDIRLGVQTMHLLSPHIKRGKRLDIKSLIPTWYRKRQTPGDMLSLVKAAAAAAKSARR